jgi:hypothetical protein
MLSDEQDHGARPSGFVSRETQSGVASCSSQLIRSGFYANQGSFGQFVTFSRFCGRKQ